MNGLEGRFKPPSWHLVVGTGQTGQSQGPPVGKVDIPKLVPRMNKNNLTE